MRTTPVRTTLVNTNFERITLTHEQSQKIKDDLKDKGYTYKHLAEKLGISESALSNYLSRSPIKLELFSTMENLIATLPGKALSNEVCKFLK